MGGRELGAHQPLEMPALGPGCRAALGTGCSFMVGIAGAAQAQLKGFGITAQPENVHFYVPLEVFSQLHKGTFWEKENKNYIYIGNIRQDKIFHLFPIHHPGED